MGRLAAANLLAGTFKGPVGMHVHQTVGEVRAWRSGITGSVGFVPTMGALHEGHLALVRQARRANDHVAVSIFVNPRQFGPSEDFETYPRTTERDLALLRAESVDAVFLPGVDEMYPPGAITGIHVPGLGDRLEGAARPGHFSGVAVVVAKLFNIVQPARAYFGRKDAQQVVVIRKMVDDLNFPVEIVPVGTVREPDGLAISSRNVYLSADEREAAGRIAPALFAARDAWLAGERSADRLLAMVTQEIQREPLLDLEYLSLADAGTLEEIETADRPAVLSIAVHCGSTRLIDSLWLDADAI